MPLTIYPSTLKIKDSNGTFHSADCIKGDQGPQGNPVDVQIDGTSILSNNIATIPIASTNNFGVIKLANENTTGLKLYSGFLMINPANDTQVKTASNTTVSPLTPAFIDSIAFYGLAKAAGDTTQAESSNAVGVYTDGAKTAIRNMIGAISGSDHATSTTYGVIKIGGALRPGSDVPDGNPDFIYVNSTTVNGCKNGNSTTFPLTPSVEDAATFYGLAKAAGDLTQAQSNNAVGTYTDDAKTAIRTMLGAVGNTNYASSGGSTAGIVKVDNYNSGVSISSSGTLILTSVTDAQVKAGTDTIRAITPGKQHASVFYGLAKAAGDTTQASSSNTIGTYTSDAKTAIKTMLGIENGISFVEAIAETSPSIIGVANTRYICGEVTNISITPPNSGTIIVRFTSGSTVAVLTLPNTVKMPQWFDATSLETNYIYELCIEDGVYGSVMTWPL